ncbi:MAG TPA: sigma-70 family RNA polymerase sigma factor [Caulobacteraceae bacterium]
MLPNRPAVIDWVALHVLPHEGKARAWLRRIMAPGQEPDDVIQDAYCRIATLESVEHIRNPRAYFFQTCRSIVLEHARRARVVRMETVTEFDALSILDEEPSPERVTAARQELSRVRRLIAALPERCRRIIEMRKIEGVPQREIAERLGVSERVVENDATRGLKLILKALEDDETRPAERRRERGQA